MLDAQGRVSGSPAGCDQGTEQSGGVGPHVPIDLVSAGSTSSRPGRRCPTPTRVSTSDAAGTEGVTIGAVTANTPAAAAGLRPGDVATAIDGTAAADSGDPVAAIASKAPVARVEPTVRRGSRTVRAPATLGTEPSERGATG